MADEETRTPEDEDSPEDQTLALADDDDDDDDDEAEFSSALASDARSVGLDVDDYDDEDALYRDTQTRMRAIEAKTGKGDAATDTDLDLVALEVALANKGELDEGLVTALEKLATDSGQNFQKLLKRIETRSGLDALRKQVDGMAGSITSLAAQNVQLRLDRWIASSVDAQKYLGKGNTGDLDADGKSARRRRGVTRLADKIAGRQRGSFTMEQMFGRALKKMQGGVKSNSAPKDRGKATQVTRLARASGSKTTDLVGGSEESQEAVGREAAGVIAKFRRVAS